MVIGAALVELHIHGSQSLKQKRGVVKSVIARVRNRYNASVAEVGGQGTWQRAVLGISVIGGDPARLRGRLERIVAFIDSLHLAEVRGSDVEIIQLGAVEFETEVDEGEAEEALPWEGS
jgi:uncharacterized protein YlxP (DUF503 family)